MSYKIDLHTHTIASGHAYNTINEMVAAAKAKKMTHLGITDHAPAMPGTCHELNFANLGVVKRDRDGLQLLMGVEANIIDYDGSLDLPSYILKSMDVVIASMHIPCLKPGTMEENTNAYLKVMDNPYVNIIGHPDDGRYLVDYEQLVKKAKETGKIIELNNSSLKPTGPRPDAKKNDITILKLCMKYNVPIIMDSDAHTEDSIGCFEKCEEVIKEVGFPEELILNRSFEEVKKYLKK